MDDLPLSAASGELLTRRAREGALYTPQSDNKVRCTACAHLCIIPEGHSGICRVRFNRQGILYSPDGYVAGLQCDPIEKKPFFHVHPGCNTLSFGMLGCNYHCDFCQNWETSQSYREPDAPTIPVTAVRPEQIIRFAAESDARVIVSTYNEPLITSEWAARVFDEAHAAGFKTAFVSNGYASRDALEYLRPRLDLFKVDLKSFSDPFYRKLGGNLQKVLDAITSIHALGYWMEIVTLVIPGLNDSENDLREMARFIVSVSPDIPWHVTAFHKDYKMHSPPDATAAHLIRAAEIGQREGLRYVYAGNQPGQVGPFENTRCAKCRQTLVERYGFFVRKNLLKDSFGQCPHCKTLIPGFWG
ncbi:MAG TPA: AmmeMemoRadiSam system radical SAM enzyme [Elusimicrobiota bacterium]|nr:AmmeMemoRadiSam system radical SAM enzyme [Elusimicrobiota bacterium]